MLILIDTCVLVSSFGSPFGAAAKILRSVYAGDLVPVVSPVVLHEYRTVLARAVFRNKFTVQKAFEVINLIEVFAVHVHLYAVISPPLRDPKDHGVAEAALEANVDALITKNIRDFVEFTAVQVMTPGEFLRRSP